MSNLPCPNCPQKLLEIEAEKKESKKLLEELNKLRLKYKRITGRISLLENRFKKAAECQIVENIKPISTRRDQKLHEYLLKLSLPDCFFNVCKDQELAMSFLMKSGIVPKSISCPTCNSSTNLEYNGLRGYCFKCTSCYYFSSAKEFTFWAKSKLPIDKLLLFVFLWVMALKDSEIACLLDISINVASSLSRSCLLYTSPSPRDS